MHDRLIDDLAIAMTRVRGGKAAGRIAREILARDTRQQRVIGLSPSADAVFLYQYSLRTVVQVPITETGLAEGLATTESEHLRDISRLESWLPTQEPTAFSWLHPRYRWLFTPSFPTIPDESNP